MQKQAARRSKRAKLLYSVTGEATGGLETHYIIEDNAAGAERFAREELLLETVLTVQLVNDCVHV